MYKIHFYEVMTKIKFLLSGKNSFRNRTFLQFGSLLLKDFDTLFNFL